MASAILVDRQGNYMPSNFPEEAKLAYGAGQVYPEHSTGAKREKLSALRYDYMPQLEVNEAYARVATHGAIKYETDNWIKGLPKSQIFGSLMRHCWKMMWGETYDKHSGLLHTDHILWNAVALTYFDARGTNDDRFPNRLSKEKSQSQEKSA